MRGKHTKGKFCVFLAGLLLLFLMGNQPRVGALNFATLTRVRITQSQKFVRLKFLFKGHLPPRSGAIHNGKTLVVLFPGAKAVTTKKLVPGKGSLVKEVRVRNVSTGVEVKIFLDTSQIEYVKFQIPHPPQVMLNLRRSKRLIKKVFEPPREKPIPVAKKMPPVKPAKKEEKKIEKATTETKPSKKKEQPPQKVSPTKAVQLQASTVSPLPPASDQETQALFASAKSAWDEKKYEKAAALFQKVLGKSPRTREGEMSAFYWARARYFLEKSRHKRTLEVADAYEDILKKYPTAPWALQALWDLAEQYTTLTFYNQAINVYQRIIKEFPGTQDAEKALFMIGRLQLTKRAFKAAENTFRKYLEQFPKGKYVRDASYFLGDALYYQGETREAIELYQSAMKHWPQATSTDLQTLENMAALFEKKGDRDRALDLLFLALNLTSSKENASELMYRIAELYRKEGRFKEALKVYSNILAQYPKSHMAAQSIIAMAALSESHPGIKYEGFQFGIDPYEFPLQAYASLLKNQKDPFVIKKALLGEGRLLLKQDPEKAIGVLTRLIREYPDTVEAQKASPLLGKAFYATIAKYFKKKKYRTCIRFYHQFRKAGLGDNPKLTMLIATCYLKLKNTALAEKTLNTLQKQQIPPALRPSYDYSKILLARSKGDMNTVLKNALDFLGRYPKSKKRPTVLAALQQAIVTLESKKTAPMITSSIKRLLAVTHSAPEKKVASRIFTAHIRYLNAQGNGKESVSLIQWHLDKYPASPNKYALYRLLGDTYFQEGQLALAEKAYLKSLKGKFSKARQGYTLYRIGVCRMKLKKYREANAAFGLAEKLLDRIAKPLPPEVAWLSRQVRLERAELLFREGRKKEALTAFQDFAKTTPKGNQKDWALYRLAELYGQQRNLKGVSKTFDTLEAQSSDPFWKRNAEDIKTSLDWFAKHAKEFNDTQGETNQ